MSGARVVTPEILDALPPEDPRAIRSRRDLVVVNALMGNARGIARVLSRVSRVVELGGGSGELLLSVAQRGRGATRVEATLVDLHPCVRSETRERLRARGWRVKAVEADAFDWLGGGDETYDAIIANLFLHHFEDVALRRLLVLASRRTKLFVACEPLRSRFAEVGARLLPLLGCNDVTRHDSVASVRAGFRGRELASLWPADGWAVNEGRYGLFTHRFVARRL